MAHIVAYTGTDVIDEVNNKSLWRDYNPCSSDDIVATAKLDRLAETEHLRTLGVEPRDAHMSTYPELTEDLSNSFSISNWLKP